MIGNHDTRDTRGFYTAGFGRVGAAGSGGSALIKLGALNCHAINTHL